MFPCIDDSYFSFINTFTVVMELEGSSQKYTIIYSIYLQHYPPSRSEYRISTNCKLFIYHIMVKGYPHTFFFWNISPVNGDNVKSAKCVMAWRTRWRNTLNTKLMNAEEIEQITRDQFVGKSKQNLPTKLIIINCNFSASYFLQYP
jgi:hypothetical protein